MIKKRYIIIALGVVSVLLGSMLVSNLLLAQTAGEYDPWLDYNEDGVIDVNDLSPLGQSYGSLGDTTKNVSVTNWPVEQEPFPENLRLKGALIVSSDGYRRDLIEETTHYPLYFQPQVVPADFIDDKSLNSVKQLIFNATYVHQKVAQSPYRIVGFPMISFLTNFTNSPSSTYIVEFQAYLGAINLVGEWIELVNIGNNSWSMSGTLNDWQGNVIITKYNGLIEVGIEPAWRLAIRLLVYANTWPTEPSTILRLEIEYGRGSSDDFVVEISIVKNP